jgi:hypothetical protein
MNVGENWDAPFRKLAPTAMESPQVEERNRGLVMNGGTIRSDMQGFCASKKEGGTNESKAHKKRD